jgi:class 3 adenylate cyclase/pSer/pThr/pTyr-binding forkhead associated (FHA) protein
MEDVPSKRVEDLIRERARLDSELELCQQLVTILFVDIAASTRFYDQHGDVAGLVMVQKCLDVLIPLIEHHGGIVVKTIGDAVLARFPEAETAVRCAIAMQHHLRARNQGRAPLDQIHVRVAINLGLALVMDNDVFGDVVNVCSRIEGATAPDEICISPSIYETTRHLPDLQVSKRSPGVRLKGKAGKLDLYEVLWQADNPSVPTLPRPSSEQLAMAMGLTQSDRSEPIGAKEKAEKTSRLGTEEIGEPPPAGVQLSIALVGADGGIRQRHPLSHPGMTVGRQAEISFPDDPLVATEHARFTQLGECVYVEDLGSPEGVFIRLRAPHRLRDADIIQMGGQKFRFATRAMLSKDADLPRSAEHTAIFAATAVAPSRPRPFLVLLEPNGRETERYELHDPETSFGRSKGTYTFPNNPFLSSTHARIAVEEDRCVLEDLGSTNGTFVRIRKRASARDGDTLMIGKQLLRVLKEAPENLIAPVAQTDESGHRAR